MAAGGALCRYNATGSPHEQHSAESTQRGEAGALHDRLVAYVNTLAHGSRRGVWGEHSYARSRIGGAARGAASAASGRVRALLAPRPPSPVPDELDVESAPSPPPSPPPADDEPPTGAGRDDADDDDDDEEWEARVAALAPTAAHARMAATVADALRQMRLERLVHSGRCARREQAKAVARKLRRALAPLWLTGGGAGGPRGAAGWLHSALTAYMPRGARRLYDAAVLELRRARPRLAERLAGAGPAPREPAPAPGAVGPESSPWLVWVASGCAALDARWERRLAALVHTRVLRGARGARGVDAAPPEVWCAAAAGAVRSALTDALADAGERSVILGGVGAGAAVCLVLARGAGAAGAAGGVRGAVLAAPPLLSAEGARDARDDALAAVKLPLLLVVGTGAADCTRAIANNICEQSNVNGAGPRRLLEVRGADEELRLPRRHRAARSLPQHALDAALVEECVRWAVETAEGDEAAPAAPSPPPALPAPERLERRRRAPSLVKEVNTIDLCGDEEYAHLPPASPATAPAAPATTSGPACAPATPHKPSPQTSRNLEMLEGRVVSRGSGGTPLALLPPRRSAAGAAGIPGAGSGGLAVTDIMQLPIVFADDDGPLTSMNTDSSPAGSPVTVTSGAPGRNADSGGSGGGGPVKYTRVILAKRGARAALGAALRGPGDAAPRVTGGAAAPAPRVTGGATVTTPRVIRGPVGTPRRLLLKKGVRLVPRQPDE